MSSMLDSLAVNRAYISLIDKIMSLPTLRALYSAMVLFEAISMTSWSDLMATIELRSVILNSR